MDRRLFHKAKVLSAICNLTWQMRADVERSPSHFIEEVKGFRSELKDIRQSNRKVDYVGISNIKTKFERSIRDATNSMYFHTRISLNVVIGHRSKTGVVEASHQIKNYYTVYIGWLWKRDVYEKLYSKQQLDHKQYFVLSIEEYRVNHPFIRLFKARAYNFKQKKVLSVWIGQSGIGEQLATIRETSSDAIKAAKSLYDTQINADLVKR